MFVTPRERCGRYHDTSDGVDWSCGTELTPDGGGSCEARLLAAQRQHVTNITKTVETLSIVTHISLLFRLYRLYFNHCYSFIGFYVSKAFGTNSNQMCTETVLYFKTFIKSKVIGKSLKGKRVPKMWKRG